MKNKTRILATHNEDIIQHSAIDVVFTIDSSPQDYKFKGNLVSVVNIELNTTERQLCKDSKNTSSIENLNTKNIVKKDLKEENIKTSIVCEEDRTRGYIDMSVYMGYLNAFGGWKTLFLLVVIQTTWRMLSVASDL